MNLWWGYLHSNGTIQVKRYFDPMDITEALESEFAIRVFREFPAKDREEAIEHIKKLI